MRRIYNYSSEQQLSILKDICNAIYIARNISMSQERIVKELERIDCLFRTVEHDEDESFDCLSIKTD
jgi:hypothetical protein